MGVTLEFDAQDDKALEYFEKSIKANSHNYDAYYHSADIYYVKWKYEKAIGLFKKAIEVKPNHTAYLSLGKVYHRKKKYEEAIKFFKQATKLNSRYTAAYAYLG